MERLPAACHEDMVVESVAGVKNDLIVTRLSPLPPRRISGVLYRRQPRTDPDTQVA